jgi:hypothetical protein
VSVALHHLTRAALNEDFFSRVPTSFPEEYPEQLCTVLFYSALHYIHALAAQRGIDIGNTHQDRERNIKWDKMGSMPISREAWNAYHGLKKNSEDARYEEVGDPTVYAEIMKGNLKDSIKRLEYLKKYLQGRGLSIQ